MYFATNVKYLRKQFNYTQEFIAESLGYKSFTTVQKWESGGSKPHYDNLVKLAELFEVDINDLTNVDLASSTGFVSSRSADSAPVPIYSFIPAGLPLKDIADIQGYVDMPANFRRYCNYFALMITDKSMMPDYREGDVVIFEQAADCNNGDECAVRIEGEPATFKKIRKKEGCIVLQPLNPDFEPIQVNTSKKNVEILGIAREIRRSV